MSRYRKHANICTMNSQKTSLEKTAEVSQKPLWAPSQEQIESTTLYLFMQALGAKKGVKFVDYDGLWRWSVEHSEQFWDFLWKVLLYFTVFPPAPYTRREWKSLISC